MNTKENINKFTEMASKNKSNFISYAETRLENKTREENSFDEDCLIIDRLAEFDEAKLLSWVKFDKTKQEYENKN